MYVRRYTGTLKQHGPLEHLQVVFVLFGQGITMKRYAWTALLLSWTVSGHAQEAPAEVLMFGVFHFANPGRDVVRVDQVDVATPENQVYLAGLASDRISHTAILRDFLEIDRRVSAHDIQPYL